MQKIISLFQRNYDGDRLVRDEVTPGAEWVIAEEGVATRKYDGTCCMVRDGAFYKRYEVGKGKRPPPRFEPATEIDPTTGKQQGWVPVGDGPEDQWHNQAWNNFVTGYGRPPRNGTFELVGPKIQGGAEGAFITHALIVHGVTTLEDVPRDFAGLRAYFIDHEIEGIVWHHPDGRMVKIKRRDFGLPWPVKREVPPHADA